MDEFRSAASPHLLADIGGTNARFALLAGDSIAGNVSVLRTADYPSLEAAALAFLEHSGGEVAPVAGAVAVASPVEGDRIEMTNCPWSFSIDEVRRSLAIPELHVVNDFQAIAYGLPRFGAGDLRKIGGGVSAERAPAVVCGPGTGLGVSALIPVGDTDYYALQTEGGHVTCAAADDREASVLAILRRRFGHVSAERCLSGDGLVNLYQALAELEGAAAGRLAPAEVTGRALRAECRLCTAAVEMFCAMLGTVAADLALTFSASSGVFVAGGIVPRLGELFAHSPFRSRFEDKGRFSGYLAEIPTYAVTHSYPAFVGLASLLKTRGAGGSPA